MAEIAKKLGVCTSAIAKAIQKKEGEEKGSGLTFLISHKADFSSSIFLDRGGLANRLQCRTRGPS